MALIKTQLSGALFQTIKFSGVVTQQLIAVRNTQETRQLVDHEAAPEPCDDEQESDSEQKGNRFHHNTFSCSDGLNDWRENDNEYYWQGPQKAK